MLMKLTPRLRRVGGRSLEGQPNPGVGKPEMAK